MDVGIIAKQLDTVHFKNVCGGLKTAEGRPAEKIAEWGVKVGDKMRFIDARDVSQHVDVEITDITTHEDIGAAYDVYGDKLCVGTRADALALYNGYPGYADMIAGRGSRGIKGMSVLVIKVIPAKK